MIMKFFKWSSIGVGAIIAVFLFLLIGVRLYLNTDRAQQQLQAKVNQAISGTITWSKSRLSVWKGEVELRNVLLSAPTNDKLVELNRLFLRISWNRLLKGELCVNNLFFETPRIYLKTDRLGNLNLVQALSLPENTESKPMDSGLPFNVVIRELKVLNGFFQYQTAEDIVDNQKNRMVFQNVNLTIRDGNLLKQKARLVCEIHGGNIAGRKIDRINLSCLLKDRCLTINALNLYTCAGRFHLNGDVDFKLDAISYELSMRQEDTLLDTVSFKGSSLKGSINSLIKLKGTGINPKTLTAETSLELFAGKLSAGEASLPVDIYINAQASMEKGRVRIQRFDAQSGRTHLKVTGDYDISSLKVAADFKLESPDLTEVLSPLGMNAFGKMNIQGNVCGTVTAPIVVAQLEGENLGFEQVKICNANAKIQFSEGMLSFDHGKIRNLNSLLDISGIVRIRDPITCDILENPGLDITVTGDPLFIEDFIEGMNGKFVLNGSIHVTPKAIVLDNIRGMLDTGSFELSGAIDLKAYQPSRVGLKLKAHDLPLMIPDTLETRLSAELDIKGTPEKSLVSGYIQMIEGQYYKNIQMNLMESLGKKSREQAMPAQEISWPFLKNMAIDITTRCIEPFVIDNNIALLSIKPDLRIYGSVNHPLISGRAEVESGTVYFQKKEFNVKRGVFDFINPYKIEPTIDVLSEIIVRKWTIFLNISGTPDNLKFNLSSNPSEREEDILSLLITGKTTRELIAREGGSSLSPGQILADVLAETVQKQIKDATGLDVVELEYKEGGETEASDEVKVTVGKELSQRITVKYGVQTKNAKVVQQVITEYKILEKLLINTFHDTEGHYGGGLQFRVEFR